MGEEVIHDLLGYDGLKIIQHTDMFHFSLDSTLLADFVVTRSKTKQIIDLGTGNAPIPLFLSLKTNAHITGIELQDKVYDLAKRTVTLNKLENQITILQDNIVGIHKQFENGAFDIVTCNPPFFKYKADSHINENEYKTIARHEIEVTLDQIIYEAKRLLTTKGRLYIVHRTDRFMELISLLQHHQFAIKRIRFVHPRKNQDANMVLVDASNNGQTGLHVLPPLYVHENDEYTDVIKEIFHQKEVK